ncbi:cysteine proteinase [Serendipita vermifera]|nr:cysteine proteinase [Serendipita vermifera]
MPRSSSATPSDSSHDSESPRKRAPSVDEDAMELDQSILSTISDDCEHIASLNSSPRMLANYDKGLNWSASSAFAKGPRAKKRKMQAPLCGACNTPLKRPFMCLECRFIGCWSSNHIHAHLIQANHSLALDMLSGTIFCGPCDDFRFPRQILLVNIFPLLLIYVLSLSDRGRKKRVLQPWQPSTDERAAILKTSNISCGPRRGFLNLGATCYMSVILQCFLHNPLLRNYFLSDKHNTQLCEQQNCMCCELDQLFTETFAKPSFSGPTPEAPAGTGPPLGPLSLLRTTWENSNDIAGYAQHDAHEYFIALLNQLHHGCPGSTNEASCNCSIHQIFAGKLQSDVKCGKCGHVNPTVDPMLDISLELKGIQEGKGTTLASCLRRFTGQEKLQPKAYTCSQCHSLSSEATKQLSIKKLPPVLCIQLKRFEHKSSASKIDIPVKFPVVINMTPYTTAAIGMRDKDAAPRDLDALNYELFGVINHEGQLNTGHYTNFARHQSEWYRFDDEKVTHATLKEVLNSIPYMCFYVKRNLEYGRRPVPKQRAPAAPPVITIDTNIASALPADLSSASSSPTSEQ